MVNPPAPSRSPDRLAAVLMSHAAVGEAVEVLGQRDDIPEVLRRVGVILRASRREGTHEAFAEGGRGRGGSRRQELACSRALGCTRRCVPAGAYPPEWVVETPPRRPPESSR